MLVRREAVRHVLAGTADREFYVQDDGVRTGKRGDGAAFFVLSCIHAAQPANLAEARCTLALGCQRYYVFEL